MDKKFTVEAKKLKNIILFNPEIGPDDSTNAESSIFIKISDKILTFEILSFRYLLIGKEEIESNENLEMILPLKRLQDIIKSFPDNTQIVFREEKEKIVNVEADGIKFKIKTCEQEGRNQIVNDNGDEYTIKKDDILESMKKVRIAMGDDEVRYYLNGINLEIYKDSDNNHHVFTVATNGHILATSGKKEDNWEILQKAIIPKKVIPEIIKILEKADETVNISFSKGKMNIKSKNLEILIKLIEGDFPDYEKVIPYNNSKDITIKTSSLKSVVEKISIVSNDKTKNIKIFIKSGNIDLEITSSDGSTANSNIETDYSGEDIEMTLNAKYLIDILNQTDEDKIIFKIEDSISPIIIQQEKNKDLLFVLMPIRV